jgi:hypothetical protein
MPAEPRRDSASDAPASAARVETLGWIGATRKAFAISENRLVRIALPPLSTAARNLSRAPRRDSTRACGSRSSSRKESCVRSPLAESSQKQSKAGVPLAATRPRIGPARRESSESRVSGEPETGSSWTRALDAPRDRPSSKSRFRRCDFPPPRGAVRRRTGVDSSSRPMASRSRVRGSSEPHRASSYPVLGRGCGIW